MNLLVTGAWQGFSDCKEELEQAGHEIVFMQWEKDELPCKPEWVEGIIGNGIFLSHPIEQFTNLKYIQLTSAGFDRVPMEYVREHDIEIHNARGVYSIPMAEFVLGGVLKLYKRFADFGDSQKKHEWNKIRTIQELNGSQVCIIGCGNVGTECAKRFKAFGAEVKGIDLYPRTDENYDSIGPLEHLDAVIETADIVVLTVPLTQETKKLMNFERMRLLKQNAILVNIARGGVIDYQAFIELKKEDSPELSRQDIRAIFDVFEEEPLTEKSPIWNLRDVIVTPHNSFVGTGNGERLNRLVVENLCRT